MRIERAIDKYLAQMQLEHDWTPRTVDSVYRFLRQLADDHPEIRLTELEGRRGTDLLRDFLGRRYGHASSTTRATRISYLHSFFAWAEDEGLIDDDPARRIKRPPKRKPDIYRPTPAELELGRQATTIDERGAWLLMEGVGLRAATVCHVRWRDIDLTHGRIRVKVKGGHWHKLPIARDILDELRAVYRALEPDPDDHVFTVTRELWIDNEHRRRTVRDPKTPAGTNSLWRMVARVCKRAGIRPLGPHALRHGFANRLKRQGLDLYALQQLMGHSRPDTTEAYLDEIRLEELERALSQTSANEATAPGEDALEAEPERWRRRELNPRPTTAARKPRGAPDSEDDEPDLDPPDRGSHAV